MKSKKSNKLLSSISSISSLSSLSSSDILSIVSYAFHIILGYLYIIPKVNDSIKRKCYELHNCRMHIRRTWLGYTIDTADGQWRDLRSNLWLLWLAMIGVSILHFYFRLITIRKPSKKNNKSSDNNDNNSNRKRRNSKTSLRSSSTDRSTDRSIRSGGSSSRDSSPETESTRSTQDINNSNSNNITNKDKEENERLKSVATPPSSYFRCLIGIGFICLLHGRHSLVIVVIAYIGFQIASWQHDKASCTAATWIYAIAVLLFKESYRLKHLPSFKFLQPIFDKNNGGLYGWQLPANFLVLRIISYSLDYHWSHVFHKGSLKSKETLTQIQTPKRVTRSTGSTPDDNIDHSTPMSSPMSNYTSDSGRSVSSSKEDTTTGNTSTDEPDFHRKNIYEYQSIYNYFSYIVYPPLYMAGPIMSFNSFMKNSKKPQYSENPITYGMRWIFCFVLLEYLTHEYPYFAVIRSGLFSSLNIQEVVVVAYVTLKMMWMKFLLIWRFFRLWALADGTLAPENMLRCMSNNYSLETFWKGWHASFNKWLVRYMYKPMGGRENRYIAVWPIFLFVALWHDIEMKLVVWGGLNSFFYVLEIWAQKICQSKLMQGLPGSVFHTVCILSASTYVIVLILVNLIGYAVGMGGIKDILSKLLTWEGIKILCVCYYFLYQAVSLMNFLERHGLTRSSREKLKNVQKHEKTN